VLDQATTWLDEGWGRRRWWATFAALVALGALWLVATPPFGSPDEPAHAMRAASAAQGQLVGDERPDLDGTGRVVVDVPATLANDPGCFAFKDTQPASCQRVSPDTSVVPVVIYVGRYPPLPYLVAGLAARPFPPGAWLYVMRLANVLACAALVASAVTSLGRLRDRRLAGLGAALTVTPSALFLFSVMNPSGPEIAAAIGTWITGYALVTRPAGTPGTAPSRRLVVRLAVAASVLALTRSLGPLWLALILVSLALLSDRERIAALVRRREVRVAGGAVGAFVIVQLAWIVGADALEYYNPEAARPGTFAGFAEQSLGTFWEHGPEQMVGNFGWLDTPAPRGVHVLWLVLVGMLVVAGLSSVRRTGALVLAALAVLTVAIPTVADGVQMAKGFDWQGRYTLPITMGLPLVGALETGRRRARPLLEGRRVFAVLAVLLATAQLACYWRAMQRNAVGAGGRVLFWIDPSWTPRGIPPLLLLVAFALAAGAFTALLLVLVPGPDPSAARDAAAGEREADHDPGADHDGAVTSAADSSPPASSPEISPLEDTSPEDPASTGEHVHAAYSAPQAMPAPTAGISTR
jgi:hypothetical protein